MGLPSLIIVLASEHAHDNPIIVIFKQPLWFINGLHLRLLNIFFSNKHIKKKILHICLNLIHFSILQHSKPPHKLLTTTLHMMQLVILIFFSTLLSSLFWRILSSSISTFTLFFFVHDINCCYIFYTSTTKIVCIN
jgi:hypothetical protein